MTDENKELNVLRKKAEEAAKLLFPGISLDDITEKQLNEAIKKNAQNHPDANFNVSVEERQTKLDDFLKISPMLESIKKYKGMIKNISKEQNDPNKTIAFFDELENDLDNKKEENKELNEARINSQEAANNLQKIFKDINFNNITKEKLEEFKNDLNEMYDDFNNKNHSEEDLKKAEKNYDLYNNWIEDIDYYINMINNVSKEQNDPNNKNNEENDNYIPGTTIKIPRPRKDNETELEYLKFYNNYIKNEYEQLKIRQNNVSKPQKKDEPTEIVKYDPLEPTKTPITGIKKGEYEPIIDITPTPPTTIPRALPPGEPEKVIDHGKRKDISLKTALWIAGGLALGTAVGLVAGPGVILAANIAAGIAKLGLRSLANKAREKEMNLPQKVTSVEEPSPGLKGKLEQFKNYITSERGLKDISAGLTGFMIGTAVGNFASSVMGAPDVPTDVPTDAITQTSSQPVTNPSSTPYDWQYAATNSYDAVSGNMVHLDQSVVGLGDPVLDRVVQLPDGSFAAHFFDAVGEPLGWVPSDAVGNVISVGGKTL